MVLGESQILGQMKDAFSEACAAGTVDTLFNRLFQQVFAVAKEVRTNTAIGACPVSVSSAAVSFVKATFPQSLSDATLLLIGAGITIDLVLRHLQQHAPMRVLVANRSVANAADLSKKYSAECIHFDALPEALAVADIVISNLGNNSEIPIPHSKQRFVTIEALHLSSKSQHHCYYLNRCCCCCLLSIFQV